MIHAQNSKAVMVILPQSIGTTEVTGTIDTVGWKYATIVFNLDTAVASSVITTMSLGEASSDASYGAIAAYEGGGATGPTMPTPNTSTGTLVKYHVDLRGRKRFLQVGIASITARLLSVTADLSRGDVAPNTDAEAGCSEIVFG